MRNIWNIFTGDLKKIRKNAIAWIVILGLSVVPSLYAWFNIAASWDPYSNTGALKVAVANVDGGYEGNLLPIELNLGEQVVSSLRENDQLDWVFTDKKDAVEGVKSGKYYASIVIPKSFSNDMMSLFSKNIKHSDIVYYLNEKENAVSPKVTDKGAGAIQKQIDEIFTKTVYGIALSVLDSISTNMDDSTSVKAVTQLSDNINKISGDLNSASGSVKAFAEMSGSLKELLDTTSSMIDSAGTKVDKNLKDVSKIKKNATNLEKAVTGTANGINVVLQQSVEVYKNLSDKVDKTFDSVSKDSNDVAESLTGLEEQVQAIIDKYEKFNKTLKELRDSLPESDKSTKNDIDTVIKKIDDSIAQQKKVSEKLKKAANDISGTTDLAKNYNKNLKNEISKSSKKIEDAKDEYNKNVKQKISDLFVSFGNTGNAVSDVVKKLNAGTEDINKLTDDASSELGVLKSTLEKTATLLETASSDVSDIAKKVDKAADSGDMDTIKDILGSSPEDISSFLSAPVKMNTNALYPVENYGSAMAPFYSTLAIWVGGIVLAAMLKVTVSEERKKKLKNVKNYQLYFGRYILFLIVGIIQSGLICLGDLYFLEIQCKHPFMFLLAGWLSSIVYVNIIYTLTVSFGDIGKAIAVVLLVMQVAGSGGTFPIEVAPGFFRAVYPLLPFTHSMAAMREAVAGLYGNVYWLELGKLCLFLVPSLLLGLVLRKPVIKLNEMFIERLESTKLM